LQSTSPVTKAGARGVASAMQHLLSRLCFLPVLAAAIPACADDPDATDDDGGSETGAPATTDGSGPADSSSTGEGPVDVGELASCPEDDLSILPFAGPAFDPQTGALVEPLPSGHVVATTVGWPKSDGWDLLNQQTNLVIGDLFVRDGLLGASFGISEACGSARTISLWRDEAALMQFVIGETHMTAIQTALPSTKAWETAHWTETSDDQPPTWERARAELDAVRQ
jgi:hypothetical protein